jgi:Tfp pilus assembly PilM family ATPase
VTRRATLPLGIDIGTLRTRVALLELDAARQPRLIAVAMRPTGDDPARAVAEAVAELPTRERRCVLALGPREATLRTATFPPLSRRERDRAARFEAGRTLGYPIAAAAIRVVGIDAARCVIGAAKRTALDARLAAARRARLRPLGVDDAGLALCRAFPAADAIVDVGQLGTTLVLRDEPIPSVRAFAVGGYAFTAAAAEALGIDDDAAEERKRNHGLAGAGERARDALVEQLASAIVEARAVSRTEVRLVALAGNGSRLAGFASALERAIAIPVSAAGLPAHAAALPPDVVRAGSPDWALAYGLALWTLAA